MSVRLNGNVAIVTGAARGIGFAISERLAADGASLVLSDIDGKELAQTCAKLGAATGKAPVAVAGDLADQDVSRQLIDTAVEKFGAVHVLVNNAGGGIIKPFSEHTPQTLKTTIDRNLWTVVWACWHALPHMRAQRYGRVINIGADSVRNGLWDHAAYNAAKGGVHGLTTGLAREYARDGITINTVAPCVVNTPQLVEATHKVPELVAKFVSVVPIGRPAEMAEVASMVSYLSSDEASFVTGQVISVNGGSTML